MAGADRALEAYAAVGLPVSERKVDRRATAGLGMELRDVGDAPHAGAPRAKWQRLIGALLAVALWSAVPSRLLETLAGHATWAFMFGRSGLSAFGSVFELIQQGAARGPLRPIPMPATVAWELITVAVLLIFADVALHAPISSTVLATDSSPYGFGNRGLCCYAELGARG